MTFDAQKQKQRFVRMIVIDLALMLVGGACAVAKFTYGMSWGLYAFVGFIAAAFVMQLWFVRGFARASRGD